MTKRARVIGLGTYVPDQILTNQDLERLVDTSDEWIVTRTGIRERRIAGPEQSTQDLALPAAEQALQDAGVTADDLDLILVATNTPDTLFPSTAARLGARLASRPVAALDIQAGCTAWIYGLAMTRALLESGMYRRALVVGADKLSAITDYQDRATAVLFGDGAGAVVLEAAEDDSAQPYGILGSYLNADGRGADWLMLPAGGSRLPTSHDTVAQRLHYLKMSGNDVFRFAVKALPEALQKGLGEAQLTVQDVDLVVPHQANGRIIDAAIRQLDLDPDKVVRNLEHYGNTSVASIPLALDQARREGRLREGSVVALAAFGAGLTWGATIVRWGPTP
jgi:3-oxoacyl-[acyl-carrier-protein] synthase-3